MRETATAEEELNRYQKMIGLATPKLATLTASPFSNFPVNPSKNGLSADGKPTTVLTPFAALRTDRTPVRALRPARVVHGVIFDACIF